MGQRFLKDLDDSVWNFAFSGASTYNGSFLCIQFWYLLKSLHTEAFKINWIIIIMINSILQPVDLFVLANGD